MSVFPRSSLPEGSASLQALEVLSYIAFEATLYRGKMCDLSSFAGATGNSPHDHSVPAASLQSGGGGSALLPLGLYNELHTITYVTTEHTFKL